MSGQEIIVEIDVNGNANVEAFGFTGGACEVATKAIREALGVETSNTRKPEAVAHAAKATGKAVQK